LVRYPQKESWLRPGSGKQEAARSAGKDIRRLGKACCELVLEDKYPIKRSRSFKTASSITYAFRNPNEVIK
jgi:hypothetical protein